MEKIELKQLTDTMTDIKGLVVDALVPVRQKNSQYQNKTSMGAYIAIISDRKNNAGVHQGVIVWADLTKFRFRGLYTQEDFEKIIPNYKGYYFLEDIYNGKTTCDVYGDFEVSYLLKNEAGFTKNIIKSAVEEIYAAFDESIVWWNIKED